MSFPTSPSNGQSAIVNGISYVYSSTYGTWTRNTTTTALSGNVTIGNIQSNGYYWANGLPYSPGPISITQNLTAGIASYTSANGNVVVSGNIISTGVYYPNGSPYSSGGGSSVSGITTFSGNSVADFLGNVGFSTTTPQTSLDLSQRTDAVILPIGTTSQRPTTSNGAVRYNTTANTVECFMSNGVSNNWSTMAGGPTFSVYATAGQSITGSTTTQISLQNKIFDTANCFNNTGSTATLNGLSVPAYAFMPPVPGYYQFNFSARQSSSSAEIVVFLYKNGVGDIGQGVDPISGYSSAGSNLVFMNGTTDYIQLYIYTGASITLVSRTQVVGSTTYGMDTYFQGFLARGI
jgi:hypothetical protein